MHHTSDVLGAKRDYDYEDSSENEEGADASNRSKQALTCQSKKRGGHPES
jgi:hypothetical protein